MNVSDIYFNLDQKDQYRLYKLLELKFKGIPELEKMYGLTVAAFIQQNPQISTSLKSALLPYEDHYILEINEKFRGIGKVKLKELNAIRYKYN